MFWQYFSFQQERWDAIFGGGLPGAERRVVASATWSDPSVWDKGAEFPDAAEDLEGYLDAVYREASEGVISMARRICASGISYDGLDKREAAVRRPVLNRGSQRHGKALLAPHAQKASSWPCSRQQLSDHHAMKSIPVLDLELQQVLEALEAEESHDH